MPRREHSPILDGRNRRGGSNRGFGAQGCSDMFVMRKEVGDQIHQWMKSGCVSRLAFYSLYHPGGAVLAIVCDKSDFLASEPAIELRQDCLKSPRRISAIDQTNELRLWTLAVGPATGISCSVCAASLAHFRVASRATVIRHWQWTRDLHRSRFRSSRDAAICVHRWRWRRSDPGFPR